MKNSINLRWLAFPINFLRSRYRRETFRAACANCPHFQPRGAVTDYSPFGNLTTVIGTCAKDTHVIVNDHRMGYVFKAWTELDACHRHPLFDDQPSLSSVLRYRPGDPAHDATAGFSAFGHGVLPDFNTAKKIARQPAPEKPADSSRDPV